MFVFGDWHGDAQWAQTVLSEIPSGSVVVHVGDFGVWPGPVGKKFLLSVSAELKAKGAHMLVVPGNHEDWDRLDSLKPLTAPVHPAVSDMQNFKKLTSHISVAARPAFATVEGYHCAFLGGAVSPDRHRRRQGSSWWPQECFTAAQVAELGPADVFFTHEVPSGVDMSSFEAPSWMFDRAALADAAASRKLLQDGVDVVKPSWLFHGHWHVGYTFLLNRPGYSTCVTGLEDQGSYRNGVEFVEGKVVSFPFDRTLSFEDAEPVRF